MQPSETRGVFICLRFVRPTRWTCDKIQLHHFSFLISCCGAFSKKKQVFFLVCISVHRKGASSLLFLTFPAAATPFDPCASQRVGTAHLLPHPPPEDAKRQLLHGLLMRVFFLSPFARVCVCVWRLSAWFYLHVKCVNVSSSLCCDLYIVSVFCVVHPHKPYEGRGEPPSSEIASRRRHFPNSYDVRHSSFGDA